MQMTGCVRRLCERGALRHLEHQRKEREDGGADMAVCLPRHQSPTRDGCEGSAPDVTSIWFCMHASAHHPSIRDHAVLRTHHPNPCGMASTYRDEHVLRDLPREVEFQLDPLGSSLSGPSAVALSRPLLAPRAARQGQPRGFSYSLRNEECSISASTLRTRRLAYFPPVMIAVTFPTRSESGRSWIRLACWIGATGTSDPAAGRRC